MVRAPLFGTDEIGIGLEVKWRSPPIPIPTPTPVDSRKSGQFEVQIAFGHDSEDSAPTLQVSFCRAI